MSTLLHSALRKVWAHLRKESTTDTSTNVSASARDQPFSQSIMAQNGSMD